MSMTGGSSMQASPGITKYLRAMAVGKAVCAGRISIDSKAGQIVTELAATDLGQSPKVSGAVTSFIGPNAFRARNSAIAVRIL
jgi:hypothetical protein